MRVAQIHNGKAHWVFETNESIEQVRARFHPDFVFAEAPAEVQEGWGYADGEFVYPVAVPVEPEPKTPEQIEAELVAAVQAKLDSEARKYRYDDIKSAVTYVDDPDPVFAAEGLAFKLWRSQVWRFCYAYLAAVLLGEKEIPTAAQLVDQLPKLVVVYGGSQAGGGGEDEIG